MPRSRVKCTAEGAWGKATVYNLEKSEGNLAQEPVAPAAAKVSEEESLPVELSLSEIIEDKSISYHDDGEDDNIHMTLPYLQSSLFGTILEDTITQLRILVECNNELRIIKARSDWKNLLSIKFGIKQPTSVDELEGIDPHALGCDAYKINKLDYDRKFSTDVISATYVDLSLNKSFKALKDYVHGILEIDEYRKTLAEDEARNKLTQKELTKQLRVLRNHIKSVIYDADVKIDNLRTQVQDDMLITECQCRYTDNWQRARTEQHIQTIHDTEGVPSETIEYYKQRTDHEQRVHAEIELHTNISINETLQQVEEWMEKYDKDMEAIDLKIQIKKNDYQNKFDERVALENLIENHDVLMKDWIHFKDEREKARLYVEKMTNSAITVQAWWRGLLVRKQLGPYKVAKKKGGGGGKKK